MLLMVFLYLADTTGGVPQEEEKEKQPQTVILSEEKEDRGLPDFPPEEESPFPLEVKEETTEPVSRPEAFQTKKQVPAFPAPPPREEVQHLNRETDNLNILFLGLVEDQLKMAAVYSINHQDRMQSAAIFFPIRALVPGTGVSLADYYQLKGTAELEKVLEKILEVDIKYYLTIDAKVLDQVEKIIGPLVVDGKKIDLNQLFTMPAGSQDELVLGELLRRFCRPEVYFRHLPGLVKTAQRYITTDFPLTPENLWVHYQIASRIKPEELRKKIIPGTSLRLEKGLGWQLSDLVAKRVVYDLTR